MGRFAAYITLMEKSGGNGSDSYWYHLKEKYMKQFENDLKNGSESDIEELQTVIITCLKAGCSKAMAFPKKILTSRKLINWKQHPKLVGIILDTLVAQCEKQNGTEEIRYGGFMCELVTVMRNNQLFNENMDRLFIILRQAIATEKNSVQECTREFTEYLPWTRYLEVTLNFMDQSCDIFKTYPDMTKDHPLASCIVITWIHIFRDCRNNLKQAVKYKDHVAKMFLWCKYQGWDIAGPDYEKGAHYRLLMECLDEYICSHKDCKEIIQPVFKACEEFWECEDEDLRRRANDLIVNMNGGNLAELDEGGCVTDRIIQQYLAGDEPRFINSLEAMYHICPEKLNPHLDDIAKSLDNTDDWLITTAVMFFRTVCIEHPEEVTAKTVLHLVATLERESLKGTSFSALVPLSEKQPELLLPHIDAIIESILSDDIIISQGSPVLMQMALAYPELAERSLEVLRLGIEKPTASMYKIGPLYNMRSIGQKYPTLLKKHEMFFLELKKDRAMKDHVSSILDIIQGRSLDDITRDVQVVQQDVKDLDDRVTTTEENVYNLGSELDITQASSAKEDLGLQLPQIDNETTLTKLYHPVAAECYSHISNLLQTTDTDGWKHLASRLRYDASQIHKFASESDPCIAMLQRWFSVNTASDAIIIVLKHLEDLCGSEAYKVIGLVIRHSDIDALRSQNDREIFPRTESGRVSHTHQSDRTQMVHELGILLEGKLDIMKRDIIDTMKDYIDSKFSEVFKHGRHKRRAVTKTSEANDMPESLV